MSNVDDPVDIQPAGGIEVILPSSATFRVLTTSEAHYVNERTRRYLTDNKFTNISDLQDVDKMVLYEMFLWRWSLWQSMNEDYWGGDIQPKQLADQISNLSGELRQLKKLLGVDKVARDRVRGDESIPVYLDQLAFRAEQFGIMRDEQHAQVITSFQRVSGLLTYHDKCLAYETQVITANGTRSIGDLAGGTHTLLSGDRSWQDCVVAAFGEQQLFEITMRRGRRTKIVSATADHRWYVRPASGGKKRVVATTGLISGVRIPSIGAQRKTDHMSPWGIAHGITFGDGTRDSTQPGSPSRVVLCGDKDAQLLKWFPCSPTRVVEGMGIEVNGLPRSWKDAPSLTSDYAYLTGWLAGYFAADGTIGKDHGATISSTTRSDLEIARDVCYRLGVPTLGISATPRVVTLPQGTVVESVLYRLSFPVGTFGEEFFLIDSHRLRAGSRVSGRQILGDWIVTDVQQTSRVETVYCAVVPGAQAFVLADNVLTGNCTVEERVEFHCGLTDLVEVLREEIRKFEAIDEVFRHTKQRLWVRKQ